ncbi:MAG: hypothetical protein ACRD26_18195 [Vicinamibacterales bacterium]
MLLGLTIVSLLAALGFGWFAWRLRRDERLRSEARVAALSSAIDAAEPAFHSPRAAHATMPVPGLFASELSAAARGTPMIRLAAGVAMALVMLVAVAMSNRGAAGVGTGPREPAPLELVSMRHERERDTLRVLGLVRNPPGSGDMTHVSAVVFAFNRAGAFVASGRAALDFTTLEPGDESPFVVTIPGVADVGRYRVSFRTEAGVVRHVDRRADAMRLAAAAP